MEAPVSEISAVALRCEYKYDPLGIDIPHPRLSWQCRGEGRGLVQSAYQIVVADSEAALATGPYLWDTGRVESDSSSHHAYAGVPLTSGRQCFWRVRVWDGAGQPSPWSKTARWEMGLMQTLAQQARWIGVPWQEDTSRSQPVPYLRTDLNVPPAVGGSTDGIAAAPGKPDECRPRAVGAYPAGL